jgi:hypothetical protein
VVDVAGVDDEGHVELLGQLARERKADRVDVDVAHVQHPHGIRQSTGRREALRSAVVSVEVAHELLDLARQVVDALRTALHELDERRRIGDRSPVGRGAEGIEVVSEHRPCEQDRGGERAEGDRGHHDPPAVPQRPAGEP